MNEYNLVAIEEIKELKARYFRYMDKKLWDQWYNVFAEDAVLQYGEKPEDKYVGRAQIVDGVSKVLANAVTVHHGHMPEIEITSENTATGIWAMFDYVEMPGLILRGYGHYEEEYVKLDDGWKIKSSRLTRLRVDIESERQGEK